MLFSQYFHTALLIWNATHGHAYPQLQYYWRLETDVLYASTQSIAGLVIRPMHSAHAAWDLLLPDISFRNSEKSVMGAHRSADDTNYPHWLIAEGVGARAATLPREEAILRGVPMGSQAYALVCVGRFSHRFLRLMNDRWRGGTIGYEEILLPTTCAVEDAVAGTRASQGRRRCLMSPFGAKAKIGVRHVRYRPAYTCAEFLRAYQADSNELWHPIKNRSCFAQFVERQRQKIE